jgi:hypothetical protein
MRVVLFVIESKVIFVFFGKRINYSKVDKKSILFVFNRLKLSLQELILKPIKRTLLQDNIIIEKILISKIASLPVLMKSLRFILYWIFQNHKLGGQEGTILITMLMRLLLQQINRIQSY